MPSIFPPLPAAFPACVVLGGTGRLGQILARVWGGAAADWHGRAPFLHQGAGLRAALAGAGGVVVLAGPAGQGGAVHADIARAVLAAAPKGARLLFASTAAVYGATPGLLAEDSPPAPLSDYGRAKRAMEGACAGDPRATCLRIGNVAGADAILGGWRAGFQLDQFADGTTPRRSYVGPITLARILAELLAHPDPLPPVLNLAQPGPVAMGALLDAASLPWTPRPAGAGAIPEVALSTARLARYTPLAPASATGLVAEAREVNR